MEHVHEWRKTAPYQVTCFNKVGNKIKIGIFPRINFLQAHTCLEAADCSEEGREVAVTTQAGVDGSARGEVSGGSPGATEPALWPQLHNRTI